MRAALAMGLVLGLVGLTGCGDGGSGEKTVIDDVHKDGSVELEVTYTRSGGRGEPPEAESLTVHADGTFEATRTVGVPAAGRFAGSLDADVAGRVASAAGAVASGAAGAPEARLMPGAPRETIRVGDGDPTDVSRDSTGPWGDLREALRDALDAAVASPVDAVRLVIGEGPAVTFETVGDATVDVSDGQLLAVLWSASYEQKGRADVSPSATTTALDASLAPAAGERLQVTATISITVGGGTASEVQLVAERSG